MIVLPSYPYQKVVLAYSGGLDTSVLLSLFSKAGIKVITVTLDFGQEEYAGQGLEHMKQKARSLGASEAVIKDVQSEFAEHFLKKAIWANSLYEGQYPNSTALGRPLIAKYLVQTAHAYGAQAIAHGSTGKGNDQLRFETCVKSLAPELEVLAPVREVGLSRDVELAYAAQNAIEVPIQSVYSVDANMWGRSIECGLLENPENVPPADAFEWVCLPEHAPDVPQVIKVYFEKGTPFKLEYNDLHLCGLAPIVNALNKLAGKHAVGVIDHVEDRVVGLKTREVYECPAATVLLKAHFDLEKLVLTKDELAFKLHAEQAFSELTYQGKWFSPLMASLQHYLEQSQLNVSGWVQVKLYKGLAQVTARASPYSLHQASLATYGSHSTFDQSDSKGFCKLYSLPTVVANKVKLCGTILASKPLMV